MFPILLMLPIYFDFSLPQNMIQENEAVEVKFYWNIKGYEMKDQKRFRVKAESSNGLVEIPPYLGSSMPIKFNGIENVENEMQLSFVIVDTVTGASYNTPVKKIWGIAYYKKYADLLNQNLAVSSGDRELSVISTDQVPDLSNTERRDPVKIYLWYLAPAFFLAGLLKSPHGVG